MGVKDEFLGSSFVKVLVTLWCLLQRNDGGVDRLGDLHLVIEDCHHQLTMVTHHRTLTGGEREGLCPAQTNAYTKLTDLRVLVNAAWIDRETFDGFALVEVDAEEPSAANALRLDDRLLYSASFPRTAARLERRGLRVERVAATEVAKAEGAVTCCSLIVEPRTNVQRRNR